MDENPTSRVGPLDGHHLKVQRIELPLGALDGSVSLARLRSRLVEEQAKRKAAEREVEKLKRGAFEQLKKVALPEQRSREAQVASSELEVRRKRLDLERQAAEIQERAQELALLGENLSDHLERLEGTQAGTMLAPESAAAVASRVMEPR